MTVRAVSQRLLPILIVGGILALSLMSRPLGPIQLTACSYGYLGAPTITGIAPNHGSTLGGDTVVITGCGFTGATAVHFGTTAAAGFTVTNDSTISATSPAHASGAVDVDVTTPAGTSAHTAADMFTFGAAPCTGVTGAATFSGVVTSAPAGAVINLQAVATGCTHPLYKFLVMNPSGPWTALGPYSARANWNWDTGGPEPAGTYHWSVWVQDASSPGTFSNGSLGTYDAFKPGVAFPLLTGPCTGVTAVITPSSPQPEGTTLTITSTATGCFTAALYEVWALAPGSNTWQMIQGYTFSNVATVPTGGINGTYRFSVWVRDFSSPGIHPQFLSSYDAFFPSVPYTVS